MANNNDVKAGSVIATDGFQAGIHDAMLRIKELGLKCTLVSEISDEYWNNWDESGEVALVVDSSFIEEHGLIAA